MKFLKLDVKHFSAGHYGIHTKNPDEQKHVDAIKKATAHYVNPRTIDEVVPTTRTYKDGSNQDVTVDACYLIVHYEGGWQDLATRGPRDRDVFYLVDGKAEDWVAKIEAALADPEQSEEAEGVCLVDKGAWKANTTYKQFDYLTNESKTYLCIADAPASSQDGILSNKTYFVEITLPA